MLLDTTAITSPSQVLTTFLTAMVGLSVATERVTDTIKQWIWGDGTPNPKTTPGWVQFIAILSGIFVSALSGLNPLNVAGFNAYQWNKPNTWAVCIVSGILASGGSAFWNHLLDILQAAKVQKENLAYGTSSAPAPSAAATDVPAPAAATGN
ncbi:MAG: hypothetical protein WCF17_20740 [Terracidiphilus sp.]